MFFFYLFWGGYLYVLPSSTSTSTFAGTAEDARAALDAVIADLPSFGLIIHETEVSGSNVKAFGHFGRPSTCKPVSLVVGSGAFVPP